jgi:hypothetical protein
LFQLSAFRFTNLSFAFFISAFCFHNLLFLLS